MAFIRAENKQKSPITRIELESPGRHPRKLERVQLRSNANCVLHRHANYDRVFSIRYAKAICAMVVVKINAHTTEWWRKWCAASADMRMEI